MPEPRLPDLSEWADLMSFRLSAQLIEEGKRSNWSVQRVEDGSGEINLDYYSVKITRLPPGMTREGVLRELRLRIGELSDPTIAQYRAVDPRWRLAPEGSVVSITMNPRWLGGAHPDRGAVVVSQATAEMWRFTTITTSWRKEWKHPVSGNREFGLRTEDGAEVFYTRGADRATRWLDNLWPVRHTKWNEADGLWRSYMRGVVAWIKGHGGEAEIGTVRSARYPWSEVKKAYFRPRSAPNPPGPLDLIDPEYRKVLEFLQHGKQIQQEVRERLGWAEYWAWQYLTAVAGLACEYPDELEHRWARGEVVGIAVDPATYSPPRDGPPLSPCEYSLLERLFNSERVVPASELARWGRDWADKHPNALQRFGRMLSRRDAEQRVTDAVRSAPEPPSSTSDPTAGETERSAPSDRTVGIDGPRGGAWTQLGTVATSGWGGV